MNCITNMDNKINGAEGGFDGYFARMIERPCKEKLILEQFREKNVYKFRIIN